MTVSMRLWESESILARVSRGLLSPASLLYAAVTDVRNTLYDRGVLSVQGTPIPAISIGNLSVGGTGKTPVAAWIAAELQRRGARPAMVLRGYGDDEPKVHAWLNPDVPVIANPDRASGIRDAAQAGATVAVLDDAFQHRRVARIEDVVLISADRWREPVHVLPSGPWRERPSALSRASLVVVTRKAAGSANALALLRRFVPLTRSGQGAVAALELGDMYNVVTAERRSLSDIRGARVLVAAGIGDPASFERQLQEASLDVTMRVFPDHHVYESADIARLARDATVFDHVFCTLKDAVKLGPRWPRQAPPPWYVSLRCRIESGEAEVSAMLDRMVADHSQHISRAPSGDAPATPYP